MLTLSMSAECSRRREAPSTPLRHVSASEQGSTSGSSASTPLFRNSTCRGTLQVFRAQLQQTGCDDEHCQQELALLYFFTLQRACRAPEHALIWSY